MIPFLGLGWLEAHHPWSKGKHTFSADELFETFINVVIPLYDKLDAPDKPPLSMPTPPDMVELGTTSDLAKEHMEASKEEKEKFENEIMEEIERREERGDGDVWYEKNKLVPPKAEKLKGFRIEMRFQYTGDNGSQCVGWYHGTIKKVVNAEKFRVKIKWDDDCLGEDDVKETTHELQPKKWNPKRPGVGAWREYLTKRSLFTK